MTYAVPIPAPTEQRAAPRAAPEPGAPSEPARSAGIERLDALTSLRFIAAAMIVFNHSALYFGFRYGWLDPLRLEQGVSFFFVLSGFILAHVYPTLSWRSAPR